MHWTRLEDDQDKSIRQYQDQGIYLHRKSDYIKLENELGKIEQLGSMKRSFSNQPHLDQKLHFVKSNRISIRAFNEIF